MEQGKPVRYKKKMYIHEEYRNLMPSNIQTKQPTSRIIQLIAKRKKHQLLRVATGVASID
jgi:hypothetical protein